MVPDTQGLVVGIPVAKVSVTKMGKEEACVRVLGRRRKGKAEVPVGIVLGVSSVVGLGLVSLEVGAMGGSEEVDLVKGAGTQKVEFVGRKVI